jgi:hypothetical protein
VSHFFVITLNYDSYGLAGLTFEIAEGGFLDIDVKIIAPDGKIMYDGEKESSGKFTFAAHTPGRYTYCFINQKGTMTPKVVMFNMHIGEIPKTTGGDLAAGEAPESESAKLDDMINELSTSLWSVKNEQEYMQVSPSTMLIPYRIYIIISNIFLSKPTFTLS